MPINNPLMPVVYTPPILFEKKAEVIPSAIADDGPIQLLVSISGHEVPGYRHVGIVSEQLCQMTVEHTRSTRSMLSPIRKSRSARVSAHLR